MSKSTFHLLNFGCRASQADGAALKRKLLEAGLQEVSTPELSGVAVLNTCTVTATADAELRQIIRRINRANPDCKILVTGCYAQRAPQEIASLQGVEWVVGNSHKHMVAEVLKDAARRNINRLKAIDVSGVSTRKLDGAANLVQISSRALTPEPGSSNEFPPPEDVHHKGTAQWLVGEISGEFHFAPVFPDDRTRPTLKIQDGCNARCSFCIIPSVRGPSRSLHPDTVIDQVRSLERAAYREIVLSGINLGSYGRDLDRRWTFLSLLERILQETAIPRIRISSIEPMDVSPELIRLAAGEPRLARHFHVPLQSGCDRILRQMNRRYWAWQYAERLLAIREHIPDCALGADVMVGFPGETDSDHAASVRFLESLPLTYAHVFPYSARPTTPAAARPDQVNGRIARERGAEIRGLIASKRQAFLAAQVGRTLSALTLDETANGGRVALTSNYLKIALAGPANHPNTLLDVRVARTDGDMLFSEPRHDSPQPA